MNKWKGDKGRIRRTETRYNPTPSIPIAHAFIQQPHRRAPECFPRGQIRRSGTSEDDIERAAAIPLSKTTSTKNHYIKTPYTNKSK